jgi:predicted alpha/beta superfamily hydrolase
MQPEGWDEYPWPASHTPATDTRLVVRARVLSPQLRNYRDLLVAIPPSGLAAGQRYPVIYLQDGQNLFDPATSYVEPWGLLEAMDRLAVAGTEALVVGIPNHGRLRRYEYSPFRDILHGGGGGDRYLAFLLETVKPLIDRDFPTRPGPDSTLIGGASLGGLISLYGAWRHPAVFGAALIQSPALWFAGAAIFPWMVGRPRPARVHLDIGTAEGTEALEDTRRLRDLLLAQGAGLDADLSYVEEAGSGHHEHAWARRFESALPFLLRGRGTP